MNEISLCMIAYNEESMLDECLHSALRYVDDTVVGIDSRTTDRTAQIVASYSPARFFYFDWHNDFSEARNQTIEHAAYDWILVLDADERLTEAGHAAIMRAITSAPTLDAFQLAMEHQTLDGQLIARDYHTRLFKSHLRYQFPIHEDVIGQTLCQIQASEAHIVHYGYDQRLFTDRHKLVRELDILEEWIKREPYHPQPNYYLAKIMFARDRDSAASTYAAIALQHADGLSRDQANVLRTLLAEYAPQ